MPNAPPMFPLYCTVWYAGGVVPSGKNLERVTRVEIGRVAIHHELSMQLICARLCKDLDTSITQLIVFRRKRILVQPDFANRSLGRQLPGREPINVHLPATRPSGWPRQRFKFRLQLIRIVRERLQVFPLYHDGARVVRRVHIHLSRSVVYDYLFLLHLDT